VHGGADVETPVEVGLCVTPSAIRGEVAHRGPAFDPTPRPHEMKFGLHLVDRLSTRWGLERMGETNRVWFELERTRLRL
jgi:hypothetical protein